MYTYIYLDVQHIHRGLRLQLLLYRKIYDMLKEAKEESLSEINYLGSDGFLEGWLRALGYMSPAGSGSTSAIWRKNMHITRNHNKAYLGDYWDANTKLYVFLAQSRARNTSCLSKGDLSKDNDDNDMYYGNGTKEQIGALEANLFHCRGCKNEVISLVLTRHVHCCCCCYCFSRGRLVSQCIPSNEEEEEEDFHCVWDHHLWQWEWSVFQQQLQTCFS